MKKMIILVSWVLALIVPLVGFVTPAYAMNKAELIEAIASDTNLTTTDEGRVLDSFFDVFTKISTRDTRTKGVRYSNIVLKRGFSVFPPDNEEDIPQMNKAELIEAIASDAGLTTADASGALDTFISVATMSLKSGKRVALVGFGSFSISKRTVGAGQVTEILKSVKFKAGDMPFLPNVEYTTTEDIIKYITEVGTSGEATKRGLTEDQARQFMDSFTNVIINTLKTGELVNIGEDFGTFSIPPIGHVDHGKGEISKGKVGRTIQIPAKKVVKFKAGADLAKTVA